MARLVEWRAKQRGARPGFEFSLGREFGRVRRTRRGKVRAGRSTMSWVSNVADTLPRKNCSR